MNKKLKELYDSLMLDVIKIKSEIDSVFCSNEKDKLTTRLNTTIDIASKIHAILINYVECNNSSSAKCYSLSINNHMDDEVIGMCNSASSLRGHIKSYIGSEEPFLEFLNSDLTDDYDEFITACNDFTINIITIPIDDYESICTDEVPCIAQDDDELGSPRHIFYVTKNNKSASVEKQIDQELKKIYFGYDGICFANAASFGVSVGTKEYDFVEHT